MPRIADSTLASHGLCVLLCRHLDRERPAEYGGRHEPGAAVLRRRRRRQHLRHRLRCVLPLLLATRAAAQGRGYIFHACMHACMHGQCTTASEQGSQPCHGVCGGRSSHARCLWGAGNNTDQQLTQPPPVVLPPPVVPAATSPPVAPQSPITPASPSTPTGQYGGEQPGGGVPGYAVAAPARTPQQQNGGGGGGGSSPAYSGAFTPAQGSSPTASGTAGQGTAVCQTSAARMAVATCLLCVGMYACHGTLLEFQCR